MAAGAAVGWLLYRGLLAIPLDKFFGAVAWMVLLLASGLAATAAAFLNQAGLVPAFGMDLWDTSGVLAQDSLVGMLLHILVGYSQRPSAMQLIFYVAALAIIGGLMWAINRPRPARVAAEEANG